MTYKTQLSVQFHLFSLLNTASYSLKAEKAVKEGPQWIFMEGINTYNELSQISSFFPVIKTWYCAFIYRVKITGYLNYNYLFTEMN